MDPTANIKDQLVLAKKILQTYDDGYSIDQDEAARLAELVIALDEWQRKGGFSPYEKAH